MEPVDLPSTLRRLEPAWVSSARQFARSVRSTGARSGPLLVVGTAEDEPWHLTAHLDDAARWGTAPGSADERLLEQLDDARRGGAGVLALHGGDAELEALAHEALVLPSLGGLETATHVLTTAEQRRRRSFLRRR